MWEAARASSVEYFESTMEKIKAMSTDAHAALDRIPKTKWCRHAFKKGSNCPMLVNNWAEAFNKVILRAREQPILTLLNNIHNLVMQRLVDKSKESFSWKGLLCPSVEELLELREKNSKAYTVRANGTGKFGVTIGAHGFVVDLRGRGCSCGLWELGGVPCIHDVCAYQSQRKNPSQFVHPDFSKSTFDKVYSHFLVPIRGIVNWPKTNYPPIQPPNIRVLPGRPKRRRHIDASEARERAEQEREARAKRAKATAYVVYRAPRKGGRVHCKKCGQAGHNAKTCDRVNGAGSSSQNAAT